MKIATGFNKPLVIEADENEEYGIVVVLAQRADGQTVFQYGVCQEHAAPPVGMRRTHAIGMVASMVPILSLGTDRYAKEEQS